MTNCRPLFSILTGTRNRATLLTAAIESVLAQEFTNYEHIIIDAASTDNTAAVLATYPHLRVVSEPDLGFFDGLNKGLRMVRGEIVGFLNSDDLLPVGALAALARAFADPTVDVVTGSVEFFANEANAAERVWRRMTAPAELALTLPNMLSGNPVLNARFFRRLCVDRVGCFDLQYPIAADREWLIRAALQQPQQSIIDPLVYRYREHAESLTIHETDRNVLRWRAEHVGIAEKQLIRPGLAPAARRALRRFHTRESSALAVHSLVSRRLREAAAWARRGFVHNPAWLFAACQRLAGHASGR